MSDKKDQDLDEIYAEAVNLGAAKLYENWAQKYDADNAAKGFHLPQVAAGFAARHIADKDAHILDAGCGTGLVGQTLSILGFTKISGSDLSPEMLEQAASLNIYKKLDAYELGTGTLPLAANSIDALICIGCMGPGHVPPTALSEFVNITRAGGHVIFNLVSATKDAQGFPDAMDALIKAEKWKLVEASEPFRAYYIEEPNLLTDLFVFEVL